jgi:surfactin synthase thioesterase subunit
MAARIIMKFQDAELALGILRADIQPLESHEYAVQTIPVPLLVLGASAGVLVSIDALRGWRQLARRAKFGYCPAILRLGSAL